MGAIDEALGQIELALVGEVVGETFEDLLEDSSGHPRLVAPMHCLICGEPLRQLRPRRARA